MSLATSFSTIVSMINRSKNELLRVPGAAIPGVLAPTIFFLGLVSVFGELTELPGFQVDSYASFLIPVSLMQGAGFTGAATGVNLARDIENGLFDRFLASPAPRWVLLAGLVSSASLRALIPGTVLFCVAMGVGAEFPGGFGFLVALIAVLGMGIVASCYAVTLALKFQTQAAAPLMQVGMLLLILCTTAYAPQEVLTGWLAEVAQYNPATFIVEAARQGFTGDVTWADTWPGLVAIIGLGLALGGLAIRGMNRAAA